MPTLDATSSKHNNKQTEPQQLELCKTTHKSHNDNKIQKYNKKIIKNKNTTKNYLFITQRFENGYTPLTWSPPPPPPPPKK